MAFFYCGLVVASLAAMVGALKEILLSELLRSRSKIVEIICVAGINARLPWVFAGLCLPFAVCSQFCSVNPLLCSKTGITLCRPCQGVRRRSYGKERVYGYYA